MNAPMATLTNMYNAATEFVADANLVKKFPSRTKASERLDKLTAQLTKKQFEYHETGEVTVVRAKTSAGVVLAAISTVDGATKAELGVVLGKFYADKDKTLENPEGQVRGIVLSLNRLKGVGVCRIGDRYWGLV